MGEDSNSTKSNPIRRLRRPLVLAGRLFLLGLAWGLAINASYPGALTFQMLSMFPLGLIFYFARNADASSTHTVGATPIVIAIWLVYAALTVYALITKKLWRFIIVFGLLVGLLLLNVAGCQALQHLADS
jgi:hypothetical protein